MGETKDLIGIYGAIDRAVAEEPERRARAARLLPVYAKPDVRWFDEFEAWADEKRGAHDRQPIPSLPEALRGLGATESRGRMRARRLFAIAVAVRAFPELLDADSDEGTLARDALGVEGLANDRERAGRLLELLADDSLLPPVDDEPSGDLGAWWSRLLEQASAQGLLDLTLEWGPRPCSGRLVMADLPGGSGVVATLQAGFETGAIGFDQAIGFLEPAKWPGCNGFWCEMKKLGELPTGVHQYHEVVSTDCGDDDAAWTISAELDFKLTLVPGVVAITEYQLSPGHPLDGDDVLVDEGSLVVRRIGPDAAPRVRVTTTKRVKFDHHFSGEALALMMCALGYASVVEDLVFSCAVSGADPGTGFPGDPPATPVAPCVPCTPDALVQEMTSMSLRILREGATAVDRGMRSARMTTRGS